jgi:hypothetical protein
VVTDGFRIDLGALENAAAGVEQTLADLRAARVDSVDGRPAAYGNGELAGTVKDFCDRWEIGIDHLATDGREIAQRLNDSLRAYLAADRAAQGRMDGIFASATGPDPAGD